MKLLRDTVSSNLVRGIMAAATLVYLTSASSAVPNTNRHPTTFLGPGLAVGVTTPLVDTGALSLHGELAPKNYRASVTVGWQFDAADRLKITGEYLIQDITYAFYSGNASRWVEQGAIGADYQHIFDAALTPTIDLSGYYSHAPDKDLSTVSGSFINAAGDTISYVDYRRVAGSNAGGVAPGIAIHPWMGAQIGANVNYDIVHYNLKNTSGYDSETGFGGTAYYNQALGEHLNLGMEGAYRKPFNNYQVYLNWNNLQYLGNWELGVFGEYTRGRNPLPNTWNTGLNVNYYAEQVNSSPSLKGEVSYKNEITNRQELAGDFMRWMDNPAVYMPQVLAITDDGSGCSGARLVSALPTVTTPGFLTVPLNIPTASHFTGTDLTFSAAGLPAGVNINARTGVISGTAASTTLTTDFTVTVRAANACGAAVGSFLLTLLVV